MKTKLEDILQQGLSPAAAQKKLRQFGPNELPSAKPKSFFTLALEVVKEPMFLLLVACGLLYLLLGDVSEALLLLGFVFIVMGITFYQERKTERALEALRNLSSPRALVIRAGQQIRIAGREVVVGDILVLSEGDRVAADAQIIDSGMLLVDESLLTGESLPVSKSTAAPQVYSGTMVVQGRGFAKVTAIGLETELGKIGKSLQTIESEDTLLQKETNNLVRNLALLGLGLCLIVIVVYGLTRGDWIKGFLAGITLAMSILPEEFPVVLTIFLALGAWRIAKKNVLTRRVPTIETLGAATVLCVDKTGTLTLNQMSVRGLLVNGVFHELQGEAPGSLPENFHQLVEFSILASQKDPFDPMEKALRQLGEIRLARTEHLHHDWELVQEYPLSPELMALSHVWQSREKTNYVIAAKGAPEAIAELCHFGPDRKQALLREIGTLAEKGLRVIGVAQASFQQGELPDDQHDFHFQFVGLVGLADPVRPRVPAAIQECHQAGIRVIMITGDYPGTAIKVAEQIGLNHQGKIMTGQELNNLDDLALSRAINSVNIFARVVPEQKLRIVAALKNNGEVVAMTGDGVNDAPALKAANIGIAMGERGTDVARESASLVLLDDDFSSIVAAVRLGRRIFANLKKAMAYTFAVHVPIAGLSLIPVLLKWPLILLPVHIVFLELIIDPACSIVFEAEKEEKDVMHRPPRNPAAPLFGRATVLISLFQGLSVLLIVFLVYQTTCWLGHSENEARALTFTTLIIANLGLILTNRSWTKTILGSLTSDNLAFWWVSGGAALFLALAIFNPFWQQLFLFAPLHIGDLIICALAGLISILWFEAFKFINQKLA